MKQRHFALVDCNNFFVSCERVFNSKLKDIPVVVLSNNDGCIISRSQEAKDLEVPMGAPLFKWQKFLDRHGVAVLSSNYKLYGEMSARIMEVLRQFAPNIEVYSIDEAFLDLSQIKESELVDLARKIRATVLQWTGVPVSIGIGPTKTLAKIANHKAKRTKTSGGVLSIMTNKDEMLAQVPVSEIWGVGRAMTPNLNRMGVRTALDFANANPTNVQRRFTIVGSRTQRELRGELCYELGEEPAPPKSLICSRSFRNPRTTYAEMSQAVSSFIEKATERLRQSGMATKQMTVHISTNRFSPDNYYGNSKTVTLKVATSDTLKLVKAGLSALDDIFEEHRQYKRAGVLFTGLVSAEEVTPTLFCEEDSAQRQRLMKTLDWINSDRTQVFVASSAKAGVAGSDRWYVSPNYLTDWRELLEVHA